jgi:hypothetical protein
MNEKVNYTEKYRCKICDKDYASASSLCNHNKKFHVNENKKMFNNCSIISSNISSNVQLCSNNVQFKKSLICEHCNKIFKNRSTKSMHKKICKKDIIEINKPIPNTTHQTNINNQQIINDNKQINNGTINNNHITINQIGKESVDCLPINDILKILSDGNNMPITCIKKLNFNKNIPENHSFCTTTLEGKHFTRINHKTQKPEKINKVDFINEVLDSSLRFLNNISLMVEFDESFRDKIPLDYQNKIKDIINNQHKFIDAKNKKAFFNCINDMSYNFKDLILETWKLIQPKGEYIIDEDEPPLIDENFNYMSSDDEE